MCSLGTVLWLILVPAGHLCSFNGFTVEIDLCATYHNFALPSFKTSHTGVNNMWILKNSTNLLSSLGHLGVHIATSIQSFNFSTLYTSIPHDLLKSRMNSIINNMPLSTKMELHDTPTSKFAGIKLFHQRSSKW